MIQIWFVNWASLTQLWYNQEIIRSILYLIAGPHTLHLKKIMILAIILAMKRELEANPISWL